MKRRLLLALAGAIVVAFAIGWMWLFAHLTSVTDTNHETGKSVVVERSESATK